jgi:hypothetical protein
MPASLRSDGVRDHPETPFGFRPEFAFAFAGIPKLMKKKHSWKPVVLLPAAAERFVELNQTLVFIVSRPRQGQFSLK